MSEFGKQMEDLAERLASARAMWQQDAHGCSSWLASFRGDQAKASDSRKIRLSELFSRTRHLLGRFRIEHLEACEASRGQRAENLARLMESCRQRRLNWRTELDRAHAAWYGRQENGSQPAARTSSAARSQKRSDGADKPASQAQFEPHAAPSVSPQSAHRAHQGHKRGGSR